jgi:hypothetical protein
MTDSAAIASADRDLNRYIADRARAARRTLPL